MVKSNMNETFSADVQTYRNIKHNGENMLLNIAFTYIFTGMKYDTIYSYSA
jgi:hypothetical protein